MDDLIIEPKIVSEDIIKQATEGLAFRQTATDRIIDILNSYHGLRKVISEFQMQQESKTTYISYDGDFAWKTNEKGQKDGPYCAKCHSIGDGLIRLIDKIMGCCVVANATGCILILHFKSLMMKAATLGQRCK